ncbi:hypothetical protein WJR50_15005 [Catalinimonas sp. 4WD22]|uniref:hypothetical protein n=1 Tax=Catalinimonas locisalis TaxID=3133978 RepID=UPI003100F3AC
MNTVNNYDNALFWERRLDEWKNRVIEQQHFHENVSSHLKKVYGKNDKQPEKEVTEVKD